MFLAPFWTHFWKIFLVFSITFSSSFFKRFFIVLGSKNERFWDAKTFQNYALCNGSMTFSDSAKVRKSIIVDPVLAPFSDVFPLIFSTFSVSIFR